MWKLEKSEWLTVIDISAEDRKKQFYVSTFRYFWGMRYTGLLSNNGVFRLYCLSEFWALGKRDYEQFQGGLIACKNVIRCGCIGGYQRNNFELTSARPG